jgi:hypothetical protein
MFFSQRQLVGRIVLVLFASTSLVGQGLHLVLGATHHACVVGGCAHAARSGKGCDAHKHEHPVAKHGPTLPEQKPVLPEQRQLSSVTGNAMASSRDEDARGREDCAICRLLAMAQFSFEIHFGHTAECTAEVRTRSRADRPCQPLIGAQPARASPLV